MVHLEPSIDAESNVSASSVVEVDSCVNSSQLRFPMTLEVPFVSATNVSTCCPAVSEMPVCETVVQDCQSPVFGTLSDPVTLLPSTSTWKLPPSPMSATRALSV